MESFGCPLEKEMAARGISTLMVDCPGSGEALRFLGLTARVETEDWAAACVDYLETRDDVDRLFLELAGKCGVKSWRAKLAYQAVHNFGGSSWQPHH